jgi:hypothetical protein
MVVLENLLPEDYFNEMYTHVNSNEFPWFLIQNTVTYDKQTLLFTDNNTRESRFFVHGLFKDGIVSSQWLKLFEPMFHIIKDRIGQGFTLQRIKVNFMYKDKDFPLHCYNTAHVDVTPDRSSKDFKTVLFYLNDSDGDTFFFNENARDGVPEKLTIQHRQSPKHNMAVMFDSSQYHASSPPRITDYRISINIVLTDFTQI